MLQLHYRDEIQKGWMRGPPPRPIIPYEEDPNGWNYTVGLVNGEGTVYIEKKEGRRPVPIISINLCARDALKVPARLWNVSIVRDAKWMCKKTPENPERRVSRVRKYGRGACLV